MGDCMHRQVCEIDRKNFEYFFALCFILSEVSFLFHSSSKLHSHYLAIDFYQFTNMSFFFIEIDDDDNDNNK